MKIKMKLKRKIKKIKLNIYIMYLIFKCEDYKKILCHNCKHTQTCYKKYLNKVKWII